MRQTTQLHVVKEGLWWLIALVGALMVFMPIMKSMVIVHYWFPFLAFLLVIWYMRLAVGFVEIPYLKHQWVRITFFLVNICLLVIFFQKINMFTRLFDVKDINYFWQEQNNASAPELYETYEYYKNVVFLSTTGGIITIVALELRLAAHFLGWRRTKITDKVVYKEDNNIRKDQ